MSFYYNSNEICFQKIDLNWAFIDIYKGFFPDICPHSGHDQNFSAWTDIMNGPYGSNAVWYGMFSQAGEPYDWSHLLAFARWVQRQEVVFRSFITLLCYRITKEWVMDRNY